MCCARSSGPLPDRPVADPVRATTPASAGAAPRARCRRRGAPRAARRDLGPLPAGAVPHLPAVYRGAAGATRSRHADLAYPARRSSWPTCAWSRNRWRPRVPPAGVRRAAAPHLAGGDVRLPPGRTGDPPAQRGARPGARRAAGAPANEPLSAEAEEVLATLRVARGIQRRFGAEACRRYVVSFTRSAADIAAVYQLAAARPARRQTPRCWTWCRCLRAGRTWERAPRADRDAEAAPGR